MRSKAWGYGFTNDEDKISFRHPRRQVHALISRDGRSECSEYDLEQPVQILDLQDGQGLRGK